jgi:heptosyltransferase-3
MIALPPHARILVVALRRLGDVLLTTPLIRSLKRAFPDAAIEALVFAGTEGTLAGNPDLTGVITMPRTAAGNLALARALWRQYDLAISTQSGDRPILFAWIAGRASAGPLAQGGGIAALKRMALDYPVVADAAQHRVEEVLDLATALGIPAVRDMVCPSGPRRADLLPHGDYAVIHAGPMFRYKRWPAEGWRTLAATLAGRGLAVVATGGPGPEDQRYSDEVWGPRGTCDAPVVRRLDGVLTWPELAGAIAGARVYIGPDTSVTHLAAATGAMTVALYGPTDPRLFGPWPVGGPASAWEATGTIQRRGNVWLVQNPLPCLPCQNEGCERRIDSYSRCLDLLSPQQVLTAVDEALASARAVP